MHLHICLNQNLPTHSFSEAFIFLQEVADHVSLGIHTLVSNENEKLSYSDFTVSAEDDSGDEIPVLRENPTKAFFFVTDSDQQSGFYVLTLKKDQRLALIKLQRKEEKQTFIVHQIVQAIRNEDLSRGTQD